MEAGLPRAATGLSEGVDSTVEVPGARLFVRSWGRELAARPPVLLIHGLGSSCRDWEPQVAALSRCFRVVAPDLRGHGRSTRPAPPYGPAVFADDLAALVERLGLGAVALVGISLGGIVALELALRHPSRVRSVVAINTPPDLRIRTPRHLGKLLFRLAVPYLLGMGAMARFLADRLFPAPGQAELRQVFVERWMENDRRTWVRVLWSMVGWTVLDRAGELSCPVLALCAEHDYFPVADQERWVARVPDGRLRRVPGHHAVTAEHPEPVNAILLDWLEGQEAVTTGQE